MALEIPKARSLADVLAGKPEEETMGGVTVADLTGGEPLAQPKPEGETPAQVAGLGDTLVCRVGAKKRVTFDLQAQKNAIRHISPLPGPGESLHAIMGGDFNGWDLVPAVQNLAGRPIDRLTATTLGFNLQNTLQLCAMLDCPGATDGERMKDLHPVLGWLIVIGCLIAMRALVQWAMGDDDDAAD